MPAAKTTFRIASRTALVFGAAIGCFILPNSSAAQSPQSQTPQTSPTLPPPVQVPFMRVLSAPGLEVVASDRTSGKIRLTVRADERRARQPVVAIRVLRGTKAELLGLLSDPRQAEDTCVLIQQTRIYPADLRRNSLAIQGEVRESWLAVDNKATRYLSTPYTLVIEEGGVQNESAAALRIRRADLQSYLARGLEVVIVPARNAAPRGGAVPGGEPLTATYLKRVPCQGYRGPTTAEVGPPARFASATPSAAGSTRLEEIAC